MLGFAILITINLVFFKDQPAFIGVMPHPYWLVILLIASRYGAFQGILAGSLAALLYFHFVSKSEVINFGVFSFPRGAYKLPFLFMLVGGILGEIRNMYKKRYLTLEDKYYETVDELQDLGLQYAAVTESKQELEKRIAFQSTTLLNLFERLNSMETLEPQSLYDKIPELLKELLNVTCSSVYLVQNNRLELYKRSGEGTEKPLPDTVELTEGMLGEVIAQKKVVCINQMYSEDDLRKFNELDLIMSAPISRKDESIVGVINVEKIPFFDYNANSLRIFEMLSYWVSIVVDKALQFQDLKDRNIADEITGAYNYLYFQNRLAYEIARAQRFQTPLSLLLLEIDKFDQMNDSEKKNVLVVINWIFSHLLREVDLISRFKNESTFAIILPGQNHTETEGILSRLMDEIDNYQLRPFEEQDEFLSLKAGFSTLQISEGSYESLVKTAEERLKHGGVREESEIFSDIQYLTHLIPETVKDDEGATKEARVKVVAETQNADETHALN